ncbi:hypothetical protein SAMN05216236_1524 [Sedimentitalea nanhaiensis]|uniref:Uncharacterized protein n=1 Tax=Sedimentitalea nanhaiensis TaxID=999627 RepID=A0A1I7E968_9RHOB|nr:hypothetical protein SAMN05216236_1524 [Sedimentitalea nanhaiensis]
MEVRIIVETTAEKGESGHTNFAVSVSALRPSPPPRLPPNFGAIWAPSGGTVGVPSP